MNLINMKNKAQIHEFYKKVKGKKLLPVKPLFRNIGPYAEKPTKLERRLA